MQVTQLYIYPVKSLGGICVQQAWVTQRGLQYDRRYMLIDESGTFLTQRTLHQLALFKLKLLENGFEITFNGQSVELPFAMEGNKIRASVWDDKLEVTLAADEYNQWFSNALKKNVRLVYMHDNSERPVSIKYAHHNEQVSFADAYPVLLISEASLDLLNSRLDETLGMDRFRPNIVVNNLGAHEEDELASFEINRVLFKTAKPCARCVVTTINQQTLETSKEPLATLAKYRMHDNKINFGVNVICLSEGQIACQ
ncbi:MAG: MOSC N-terminal beta barrel domain-containing protein [Bacteroidota bacterium]